MIKTDAVRFYLNNLVNAKLPSKTTDNILEFVEERSQDLLGFDVCEKWGGHSRRSFKIWSKNTPSTQGDEPEFEYVRGIKALRQMLASMKIRDISVPGRDKHTECIATLFNLNKDEAQIIQVFVNMILHTNVHCLIADIVGRVRFSSGFNMNNLYLLSAFCGVPENKIRKLLAQDGVLQMSGLLFSDEDGDLAMNKFLQKCIAHAPQTPEKLKQILLGDLHHGNKKLDFSHIKDEYDYIKSLLDGAVKQQMSGINILIYGPTGTGKTEMAKHIVDSLGYKLYGLHTSINGRQEKNINLSYLMHAQRILCNDTDSVVMLDEAEDVFSYNKFSSSATSKLSLNQLLEKNKRPVIWLTNDINSVDDAYLRRFSYCLEMKKPCQSVKVSIWQNICRHHKLNLSQSKIEKFAEKYDVAPGVINNAVRAVKLTGDKNAIERTIDSFCVATTGKKPRAPQKPDVDFNTALLNTDIDMQKLTEQIVRGKNKNFSLCLYGVSGTGKSAYARHLAQQLGMKIIQKRASDLKDKYVGETEKRIAAAFAQAADQNAILVFDEADSFLRSRTSAQTSWEVSAVNEMLTQMENSQVPFICTTNLMKDIDNASLRRFLFKIKYDYMTRDQVKIAFSDFFGKTPTDSEILKLEYLTPGDFVVAKRKADILGVTEISDIIDLLVQEMNAKDIKKTSKIGFN